MSQRKTVLTFKDEKDAARLRKDLGLRPIKAGMVTCLNCPRKFFSVDVCTNRMCHKCLEITKKYNA